MNMVVVQEAQAEGLGFLYYDLNTIVKGFQLPPKVPKP